MAQLPKKIGQKYYSILLMQIRMMEALTKKAYVEKITPLLNHINEEMQIESKRALIVNASSSNLSARLRLLLRQTQSYISSELEQVTAQVDQVFNIEFSNGLARRFVKAINYTSKKHTLRELQSVVGKRRLEDHLRSINLLEDRGVAQIVTGAIEQNTSLIRSIPEQYMERVRNTIYDGLDKGRTASSVGKELAEVGNITERRGKFIARDQMASVYGETTKQRQQNLGIRRFKWLTSHDERVRDTHQPLDGKIFEWDTGATGPGVAAEVEGLKPGEDFNCRCTSSMVEEDVLALFDRFDS